MDKEIGQWLIQMTYKVINLLWKSNSINVSQCDLIIPAI